MLPLLLTTIGDSSEKAFFTELYRKFYPLMKSRASKLTNDSRLVDDVVQDTLVRLLRQYERLRELDENRLAGYIALTVRSAANNALRRKYREQEQFHTDDWETIPAAEADSPELSFVKGEELENQIRAVKRLPEPQRNLLLDKYVLEIPNRELAEQYQTSEPNIRKRLSRARRMLCNLLEELR